MRQLTSFSLLFILAITSCAFAKDVPFSKGEAELHTQMSNGKKIDLVIETTELDKNYPYPKALMWGGDEIEQPRRFMSAVTLKFNNQEVRLPLSSYADLGDPNSVKIETTKKGFDIDIVGSDAAGSYEAILAFENIGGYMLLHSRRVKSGEFPEQAWEETVYSYVTETD